MKNDDDMCKRKLGKATVVIALVCLSLSIADWYWVTGSKYGMFYGVFVDPPSLGVIAHGPNYYQSINSFYFYISILLLVFMIGKILGRSRRIVFTRIFTLCFAVFPFLNMLMFKKAVFSFEQGPSYQGLQASIYLDVFCFIGIATIICLEIILLRSGSTSRLQSQKVF